MTIETAVQPSTWSKTDRLEAAVADLTRRLAALSERVALLEASGGSGRPLKENPAA